MTDKAKKPVVDADPKAIARWDTEGGAPASGDQSTTRRPIRPRDPNQLAKFIVDVASGEVEDRESASEEQEKDASAVALGRRGGLKGGNARAASMTAERRAEIAKAAAQKRWGK